MSDYSHISAQSSPNIVTGRLSSTSDSDQAVDSQGNKRVEVLSVGDDEALTTFFSQTVKTTEKVEVTVDDFDHVFMESQNM